MRQVLLPQLHDHEARLLLLPLQPQHLLLLLCLLFMSHWLRQFKGGGLSLTTAAAASERSGWGRTGDWNCQCVNHQPALSLHTRTSTHSCTVHACSRLAPLAITRLVLIAPLPIQLAMAGGSPTHLDSGTGGEGSFVYHQPGRLCCSCYHGLRHAVQRPASSSSSIAALRLVLHVPVAGDHVRVHEPASQKPRLHLRFPCIVLLLHVLAHPHLDSHMAVLAAGALQHPGRGA
mmetsp:Transcript_13400/g.32748  ORF Transcript_13400/g.32748 Transcript_13400/m.32748 type:complete len:232 (+) Transcript_13400:2143-2838(+)